MFVLIGILMISVFAFMSYLNSKMADVQTKSSAEKIVSDALKTGTIPFYVGLCLERNLDQAIKFVGESGGDIYMYNNGPAPTPKKFLKLSDRVLYGIEAPNLQPKTLYPPPPGYPGGKGATNQVPLLDYSTYGLFGKPSLRKLCNTFGANRPGYFSKSITKTTIAGPICLTNTYGDFNSIQLQIEQYISKNVLNCTNWTAIRQETGYNVTPMNNPSVVMRLGLSDIDVEAKIPLKVQVGGYEPVIALGNFHTKIPVRLKRIVELANMIVKYDSYSLDFNLTRDFNKFTLWDSYIDLRVLNNFQPNPWDDVIAIIDTNPRALLNGKPFIFRFARENRYPALDFIHEMSNFTGYDLVVMENDTIFINPNPPGHIYDPDEDNLTYHFTGWKENCDEKFNFKTNTQDVGCSINQHIFNPLRKTYTRSSPKKWSTSALFKKTGRNTSYTTGRDDIGSHNMTVWVCDDAGLCDFQLVRILVFDFPILFMNGSNDFDDVPDNFASVEDAYELREATTAYSTPLLGHLFSDPIEPFQYMIKRPLKVLDIPLSGFNITNITEEIFLKKKLLDSSGNLLPNKTHLINLTATSTASVPPYQYNVTVMQCLPHRSLNPPWPYNVTADVFQANHACCSAGGERFIPRAIDKKFFVGAKGQLYLDFYHGLDLDLNPDMDVRVDRQKFDLKTKLASFDCHLQKYCTKGQTCPILNPSNNLLKCDSLDRVEALDRNKIRVWFKAPTIGQSKDYYPEFLGVFVKYGGIVKTPQYGTYFGTDKTCFQDKKKVGLFSNLTQVSKLPYLASTTPFYNVGGVTKIGGATPGMYNDVLERYFQRQCSGKRGNICDGPAYLVINSITECPDRKSTELESCYGPKYDFGKKGYAVLDYPAGNLCKGGTPDGVVEGQEECDPKSSGTPTNAKCDAKLCNDYCQCPKGYSQLSGVVACEGYKDETFESKFNLPRYDGTDSDGSCSLTPTCKNAAGKKDTKGPELCSAMTCNAGTCDKPTKCKPCNRYDGLRAPDSKAWYCNNPSTSTASPKSLQSNLYSCDSTASSTPSCKSKPGDPDKSMLACNACAQATTYRDSMAGTVWAAWKSTTNRWVTSPTGNECCGDDPGEGNYPYTQPIYNYIGRNPTTPFIPSNSNEPTSTYEAVEITCNDYFGNKNSNKISKNWIDNDCDGKANCQDTNCAGRLGPNKGTCCINPSVHCKQTLPDAVCGTNGECDCQVSGFNSWTNANTLTFYSGLTYSTCIGDSSKIGWGDKYTELSGVNGKKFDVRVTFSNYLANGKVDCKKEGYVIFRDITVLSKSSSLQTGSFQTIDFTNVKKGGFYIKNSGGEDCKLEIEFK